MRIPILPFVVMAILCFAVDTYIYLIAKRRCRASQAVNAHVAFALAMYALLVVGICLPRRSGSDDTLQTIMWILFGVLSVYVSKTLFVIVDIVASLPQLWKHKRVGLISLLGGVLSVILFLSMWWGALVNRFNVQVVEVDVPVKNLPDAFDGYRIVQFSDMHLGTFGSDTTFVSRFVDKVNSLNGDVIFFTGDIVNRRSEELQYHIAPLSRLESPGGVIAILGNHDYGDYSNWPNEQAKQANMEELYDYNRKMGWDLLRNEYRMLYHGGDSIAVIGVENVGDPPFKIYGSLKDSYPMLSDDVTKILLSHNPAHWQD